MSRRWNAQVTSAEEQRNQKREAILKTGASLFARNGFDNTSLDDVAKALNITKRTLYYYFNNKEDILFSCVSRGLEIARELTESAESLSSNPLDRIEYFIQNYSEMIEDDIAILMVTTDPKSFTPEHREAFLHQSRQFGIFLRDNIISGIDAGDIVECNPDFIVPAIFGAMNWLPSWNRGSSKHSHRDVGQEFTALFIRGLRKPK